MSTPISAIWEGRVRRHPALLERTAATPSGKTATEQEPAARACGTNSCLKTLPAVYPFCNSFSIGSSAGRIPLPILVYFSNLAFDPRQFDPPANLVEQKRACKKKPVWNQYQVAHSSLHGCGKKAR